MKLAWFSNSPWAGTGYGAQTAEVLPRLKADGHELCVVSNYGLAGAVMDWQGIPVLPMGFEAYSNDLAGAHVANWIKGQGWGICLYDVWTIKGPLWNGVPLAAWVPVDHDPAPAEVANWFRIPGELRLPIAMSKFGKERLESAGLKDVMYAPHSVNTQLYTESGNNFREQLGIPKDVHLTVINGANKGVPSRKSFPEMLAAWSIFAKDRKDAWLYLHTDQNGLAGGIQLKRLLAAVQAPEDRIRFVPQYQYRSGIPTEEMPAVYRMGDVLLSTSRGEGFGVPVLESLAVGVPAIVSDWTAQPELLGAGWKVSGQPEWNEGMASWWLCPNIGEIVAALEESYAMKGDTKGSATMAAQAREFALGYDTDTVYARYWRPILTELESRLPKPAALNREQRRALKAK